MKVCYVTHMPNLTGASQSLLDLLRALEGSEVEPVVLLGRRGPLEDELEKRGVPFQVIRYANEIKRDRSRAHSLVKEALNVPAKRKVKAFFKAEGIDLVHNNSMLVGIGMECAKELNIPYIAHIREYVQEDLELELEHPEAQSRLVQQADGAIAVSEAVAKAGEKKYGAPKSGIRPIYDGIDIGRYLMAAEERQAPLSGPTIELLLAGRIAAGKGQLEAAKAVALLNEAEPGRYHLTIAGPVGTPSYAEELEAFVATLPDGQVDILPFIDDLRAQRAQTDIALLCSVSEAMGRVTIESMLAGCLVVGANGGATPELLADGRGVLYEPGNVEALAEAIRKTAAHSPSEVRAVVERGQQYSAETFAPEHYAEQILELYHEVLS